MKILIVDDHAVVRRGLQQIVLDEYKDLVFGEATNAQEALEGGQSGRCRSGFHFGGYLTLFYRNDVEGRQGCIVQ